MNESCGNCRFFTGEGNIDGHGLCRRNPPSVVPESVGRISEEINGRLIFWYQSMHPGVSKLEWCGEWSEKDIPFSMPFTKDIKWSQE